MLFRFKRGALLLIAAVLTMLMFPTPAGADVLHTGAAHDTTTNLVLSVPWLTMIVGLVIPLITNYVMASTASSGLKAAVTLLLSAITAAVSTIIDSGGVFIALNFISAFLTVYLAAQASYAATKNNVLARMSKAKPGGFGAPAFPRSKE